ncbi:MAG: HD domain-containing protein [Promethearchaeia archaeon]
MKTLTGLPAEKNILDPIHGPIPITPVEYEIISNPIFQRLRYVTQLSQTYLVFPGATHNRFQHSLGTVFIMDKLLNTLKENDFLPGKGEHKEIIQKMRLAALLHDCGHIPFSHTFESKMQSIDHEYIGKCIIEQSIINEQLEDNGISSKTIGGLITGEPNAKDKQFLELTTLLPLLSSHADCDRMDYLLRDAYFTGVPYGTFDIDRITNFVALEDQRIGYLEKAQNALEDFLFSRFQMYKIVYVHKTVIGYELLLQKIYRKFIENYRDEIELPFFLPSREDFNSADSEWFQDTFYNLTESDFFTSVQKLLDSQALSENERSDLQNLYERITHRKPIKNCFRFDNLTEAEETEYCDKEEDCYEVLKEKPEIVNHWSFLRYDPVNPVKVADSITREEEEDMQDPKYIRIIDTNAEPGEQINLLQTKTNSYIKTLARHHRVLISYYHEKEEAQTYIRKCARNIISADSNESHSGSARESV